MSDSGTGHHADRGFEAAPIYLGDLDKCRPAGALSSGPGPARWTALSYESDLVSGVMLLAGPETGAQEITYPLPVSGWHAVSIGALGGHSESDCTSVEVRLSGEKTFSRLTAPLQHGREEGRLRPAERGEAQLREVFWKVADLTGQALVLRQMFWQVAAGDGPGSVMGHTARVAYIKLVPLSNSEVSVYQADLKRTDRRRLFAHNDAHGIHYGYRPTTAEEIRRNIEPYRDTDFSRLYWEAGGGDHVNYFSKIGRLPTYDGIDDFGRQGDRLLAESWRSFRDQGVDPFQVALDYTHEIGMEFHPGYRVAGFHFPAPGDLASNGSSFYERHPELRGTGRKGNRTPRLAFTYSETRRFVVSLLREVAAHPVDGIALLYNRRPPLVEYEPPLVEGFKREYGDDPFQLDEMDTRWLLYRAGVLTQFMREVREAMDTAAREQGRARRIKVSAIVMSTEQENLYRGMDLGAWVKEGLVDTLIPDTSEPDYDSRPESWTDPRDLDFHGNPVQAGPQPHAPRHERRGLHAKGRATVPGRHRELLLLGLLREPRRPRCTVVERPAPAWPPRRGGGLDRRRRAEPGRAVHCRPQAG